ncbi:anthranilate phosphoribosyltransferase [Rhizoclosmatium hyalinum]|nr:anthranilate phosphoribosyltransferase [Rhizoclosmatium hyalinum]
MPKTGSDLLKHLLNNPAEYSAAHAGATAAAVMRGELSAAQAGAFLAALKLTGKDGEPGVVAAVAAAMRTAAEHVAFNSNSKPILVDIVGTGGDGQDTFNVSTASAIVAAGAGVCVAKHGNRSSSSQCGSADVLEALGANLNNVGPAHVERLVHSSRFVFLFAQRFHPSMKLLAGPRKELGVKTIFNVLGPLTNPACPQRMIVGVFSKAIGPMMAEALRLSGVERAWVVHGALGLDEIAPEGETYVWSLEAEKITSFTITPASFSLPSHPLSDVRGGDREYNSGTMNRLLDNKLEPGTAVLDFVLMNAAALLHVAGKAETLPHGVELARESLRSGAGRLALDSYVAASQIA